MCGAQHSVDCLPSKMLSVSFSAEKSSVINVRSIGSSPFLYSKVKDETDTYLLILLCGRQRTRVFTEMSDCSFNECAWERDPYCHRCTSPQLIALCMAVSPLYSTPDKMCVSVHDACNDKQLNKVRWVCIMCFMQHLMLLLFHRIF